MSSMKDQLYGNSTVVVKRNTCTEDNTRESVLTSNQWPVQTCTTEV